MPKKLLLPNTSYITNHYDSMARQLFTKLNNSSHTTLNKHEYVYNAGHQRTKHTRPDNSHLTFSYDPIGQLTIVRATNSGGSLISAETKGYAYDAAWNLNRRTNNSSGSTHTFSVDVKNQLTNATPVGTQTYDDNGNVTYNEAFYGYVYDDENQLVNWYYYGGGYDGEGSVTSSEDWRTDFVYDGRGRLRQRVEYQASGFGSNWEWVSETRYVYDGMRVIQERAGNNTPTVGYTRGNDLSGSLEGAGGIGGLLARAHGYTFQTGNWSTHNYYHADGGGNVTYLVNSSQTLAASYKYDAYGNLATSPSGSLAGANVYRFSSKEYHLNSGFYYYGYRWYAPNLQRWPNRDPIGENGGINLYGYVRNRPVNAIDADGLVEFPRLPTIPSFPWPNPLPRPNPPPRSWPSWPRIKLPEDPISCGNRIKNEVWEKFAPGGQLPPGDPSFQYGHCVAHCRIQRECLGGRFTSWAGGVGKEILDEFKQWGGQGAGWEGGDMDANRRGRKCGRHNKDKSCEEACKGAGG